MIKKYFNSVEILVGVYLIMLLSLVVSSYADAELYHQPEPLYHSQLLEEEKAVPNDSETNKLNQFVYELRRSCLAIGYFAVNVFVSSGEYHVEYYECELVEVYNHHKEGTKEEPHPREKGKKYAI